MNFRCPRALRLLVGGIALLAVTAAGAAPPEPTLDTETLPRLLAERGYAPGPHFKALVVSIRTGADGALETRWYDYRGTSADRDDWWPASTVKLYAAIAALERAESLGFGPKASVELRYEDGPVTTTLATLVERAITPSDNLAYDRLVEVAGVEWLNDRLFTRANGLARTILLRAYKGRVRDPRSGRGTLRHSPAIRLAEGKREVVLPEHASEKQWDCIAKDGAEANCTTLHDLAEAMRRVMLHERLPKGERFRLGAEGLAVLRAAMRGKRSRGMNVVDGLRGAFGERKVSFHSKPGYAADWFSDNVFVEASGPDRRWIVTMANKPGRDALDEAARHVGALLAADLL